MGTLSDLFRAWRAYRPSKAAWFGSGVACVLGTMIVGFTWGGWVTGSTAAAMSADSARDARREFAAAYCVSRFEAAPDAAAKLAALKNTDSWLRSGVIDKGGWAKLPGSMPEVGGVAEICADRLAEATLQPVRSAAAQ